MARDNYEYNEDWAPPSMPTREELRKRQAYLVRLVRDSCQYDEERPPCQLMPWLLGTNGIDLVTMSENGIAFRLVKKDVTAMIEAGVYFWADSHRPIDRSKIKVVNSFKAAFLVHCTTSPVLYRPKAVVALDRPTYDDPRDPLQWKRLAVKPFLGRRYDGRAAQEHHHG